MTFVAPLLVAAAFAAVPSPPAPAAPEPRFIRVTGAGRDFAAPDIARVDVGVETRDKTSLARANAGATARMQRVLTAIQGAGVAPRDVRTVQYDVDVERSFGRSSAGPAGTVTAYRVTNRVAVTVRDLSKLGALLDDVVAAGASSIDGLVVEKEDVSGERGRALAAAVADARSKAAALASSAGATLGEVVRIVEVGAEATPDLGLAYGIIGPRRSGPVPLAAGRLEIAASLELTFAIR